MRYESAASDLGQAICQEDLQAPAENTEVEFTFLYVQLLPDDIATIV